MPVILIGLVHKKDENCYPKLFIENFIYLFIYLFTYLFNFSIFWEISVFGALEIPPEIKQIF